MVVRVELIRRGFFAWLFAWGMTWPALAEPPRVPAVPIKTVARTKARVKEPAVAELRRSLRQASNQAFPTAPDDVQRQAREFVALYRETAQSSLGAAERSRSLARLRGRLVGLSKAIARNEASHARIATASLRTASLSDQADAVKTSKLRPAEDAGRGGAPRSNAQDLIDLIQNTIAPESWDVMGGQGTIMYWEPGFALVVRQTDDVHEQIGGLRRLLGN
ncbi:MAG TPA: hypothetical protein VJ783_27165 [Pirellulales bacterium]|nr:hypothetical protein [Pirellulales bacterium]